MLKNLSSAEKCLVVGLLHIRFLQRHRTANVGWHGIGRAKAVGHPLNFGAEIGPKIGLSQRYTYQLSHAFKMLGEELLMKIARTTQDNSNHIEFLMTLNQWGRANYIKSASKLRNYRQLDHRAVADEIEAKIYPAEMEVA
jgi:hypothetical protein